MFRVDAGPKIGLGHLRRCLTLADVLRSRGWTVRLVSREPFDEAVTPWIAPYAASSLHSPAGTVPPLDEEAWDAEASLAIAGIDSGAASWVVVDHYQLAAGWERRLRNAGHRVLAMDDFRHRRHCADILTSDSGTPFEPTLNETADSGRVLVGRKYALIGPEYAYTPASPPDTTAPRCLLVSYGGSDPTGETLKAVRAIKRLKQQRASQNLIGRVNVVIGHLNGMAEAIAEEARGIPNVVFHQAPQSLAPLMRTADLFLTAGGGSMLEALALRKPCLVTITGDNQVLSVEPLAAARQVRSLGAQQRVTPDNVADAILALVNEFKTFAAAIASHPVVDHLGAQRICDAMTDFHESQ